MRLEKIVCLLLIVCVVSSCSHQTILFTSDPPGALVSAGGGTCTTPCELSVPVGTATATFTHYSCERKEVTLSHITNEAASTNYALAKTGEYTLIGLGLPLLVVGGTFAILSGLFSNSDPIKTESSSENDQVTWIATGGFVAGALFLYMSRYLHDAADDAAPPVHVTLEKAKFSSNMSK